MTTTTFRASKGYHFSADGTEKTTWAHFEKVPKSEPIVYEFTTDDKDHIAALRKLIDDEVAGYADIVEVVEKPAKKAPAKKAPAKRAGSKATDTGGDDSTGDDAADDGDSGDAGDSDSGDEGQNGD